MTHVDDLCVTVGVFIRSEATDDKKIFSHNYHATREAIARAMSEKPSVRAVLEPQPAARDSAAYVGG